MSKADVALQDDAPMPTRDSVEDILAITPAGPDRFAGTAGARNHIGSIFGGRLLAQTLLSAMMTVETLPASSLHAYFLAAGRNERPLEYRVTRLRDSRRFANRQVTAFQDDLSIFTLMAEFHEPEQGFEHQAGMMPDVPPPEQVAPIQHFVRDHLDRLDPAVVHNFSVALPVEMRPVAPERYFLARASDSARPYWFRQSGAAAIDDMRLHQCLLAFASDYWLAGAAAMPHFLPTNSSGFFIASLDHAMWFHHPARCEQWMLHDTSSPAARGGVGLSLGRIFDRAGRLIASTAQESVLRRLKP